MKVLVHRRDPTTMSVAAVVLASGGLVLAWMSRESLTTTDTDA